MDPKKQEILDTALAKVQTTQAAMAAQEEKVAAANWKYNEMMRQYNHHTTTGYADGAQWAKKEADKAKVQVDYELGVLEEKKAAYTAAKLEYDNLKNTLLTAEEKKQQEEREKAAANYAAATTRFWIFGGIILVIVILGVVIYKSIK